jgi:hypothetical protein
MVKVGIVVPEWSKVLNSPTLSALECWMNFYTVSLTRRLLVSKRYPYAGTKEGSLAIALIQDMVI